MKRLLFLLMVAALSACTKTEDLRPSEQVRFAALVKNWRDQVNQQTDPTARRTLLENGVNSVKAFILDSLSGAINNWQVRVLDVDASKEIINYGMNIDEGEPSEKTRFQSIVFEVKTRTEPADYAEQAKKLKAGDITVLSGTFVQNQGFINLNLYKKSNSKNVLDNPALQVEGSSARIQ